MGRYDSVTLRRYIRLSPGRIYDLTSDVMPNAELAARLSDWCSHRCTQTASCDSYMQIGFLFALLRLPSVTARSEASGAQVVALNIGAEIGRQERRRRLQVAGIDTTIEDQQEAKLLAKWEEIDRELPATVRASALGITLVGE